MTKEPRQLEITTAKLCSGWEVEAETREEAIQKAPYDWQDPNRTYYGAVPKTPFNILPKEEQERQINLVLEQAAIVEAIQKYKTEEICELHLVPLGDVRCDCGSGEDLE